MKFLTIGESDECPKEQVGHLAHSANELARAGLPVPYSIVITKKVFKEFLVDSNIVDNFFALLKKGKGDKAATLVLSAKFPKEIEESLLNQLEEHKIKEFDVHASTDSEYSSYRCLKQRKKDLTTAIKACWAESIKQNQQGSAVMITKHLGTVKNGILYSHHPLNNSPAHCVISLEKPKNAHFYVNKQNGKVLNAKEFHNLESPLLVREKNELLQLAQQLSSFSKDPIMVQWTLGEGAYALSYKKLEKHDRDHFFNVSC